MLQIEISDESAYILVCDILIQDYAGLTKSIQNLEDLPDLEDFQQEDLKDNRRYREAMAVMLEYYLPYEQWKAVVGS
jgi:hypothetical protein